MPKFGTLVMDEVIMPIRKVEPRDGAIRLHGTIIARRSYAAGHHFSQIRWHGSDGSLITNVPDAALVLPDPLEPGYELRLALDVRFDDQLSAWEGQDA